MPRRAIQPEPLTPERSNAAALIPYLAVADARAALAWYADALGARPRGEPIVMPDGRIGHAELELAGSPVMLSDEHPEIGVRAPQPGQGAAVTLHLEVLDVDTSTRRAVEAGARLDRPPADHPYGRNAVVIDPFGHRWMLAGPARPEPATSGSRHGDVRTTPPCGFPTSRSRSPSTQPCSVGASRQAAGPRRDRSRGWSHLSACGGQPHLTTLLCFAVEDVAAAVERVRAAGGDGEEPRREPYGVVADCIDDQGMAFSLLQDGATATRSGDGSGRKHGELVYLVLAVRDAVRTRAFFSALLGWRFSPGRVEDGWNVEGVRPLAGLHGGNETSVVVPMFAVDDVHAAVERVRAAGGTATEAEQMSYAITSDCRDDQGFSFSLGQR